MEKQSRSLTTLILAFGLFAAAVPLALYQGVALLSSARILENTHAKELQHQNALTANLINQAIAEKVAFLNSLSDALPYLSALPRSLLLTYLEEQKAERNDLMGLAVGSLEPGRLLATAGFDATLNDPQKPAALSEFLNNCRQIDKGGLLVSDAIALGGTPALFFCTRAPAGGTYPLSILAMDFHNIALLLSQFEVELEGAVPVALLNDRGEVIYATGSTLASGEHYGLDEGVLYAGEESALFRNVQRGDERVMAAVEELYRFGDNRAVGWRLVAPLPETVIQAKLFETLKLNILLGLAIVIAAVVASVLLARLITRPLRTIAAMARRIREGDYATRIQLKRPPAEIAVLADALNEMTERIESRTREIRQQQSFGQFLLDSSPVFMMTVRSGMIEYVNRRFLEHLGFDSLTAFLEKTGGFKDLIARIDDRSAAAQSEEELRARLLNAATQHVVYLHTRSGGAGQPFIVAAAHFSDQNRSLLTFADVSMIEKQKDHLSDRVQKAEEARRAQQELLQMQSRQAQMGEMIGAIAHQWKQPLTVLGLQVQELEQMFADDALTQHYLEAYAAEAERMIDYMSKTVDDFRNFFRPAPAQLFWAKEAIARLHGMLGKLYEKQGVKIVLEIERDARIKGSVSEFQQVLVNLINNARDAFGAQEISKRRITVRLRSEEGFAVVEVEDNAGGISAEVMPRIFDSYFTTKAPDQGTGIGLFMSKQIIEEKMGGTLSAENTAEGAKFTIRVPLAG